MGCRTAADEAKDNACDAVDTAIQQLSKIVIENVHGHDHYTSAYSDSLEEAFDLLRKVKKMLHSV